MRLNFRTDLEKCVMGKYDTARQYTARAKSPSAISVQEPVALEIVRVQKLVRQEHPLLHIVDPDSWKNIPFCIVEGFKAMVKVLHEGEKQNFDFQVKTNERLYKLQKQLDERKAKAESSEKQL